MGLASRATDTAVGYCVSGDFMAAVSDHASLCYVATPSGQAGLTFSKGGGITTGFGVQGSAGPLFSNAHDLQRFSGPFGYATVSGRDPLELASATGEIGESPCGVILAVSPTVGFGPALPGASVSVGLVNTTVYPAFSW